jgi:hypothetical protein
MYPPGSTSCLQSIESVIGQTHVSKGVDNHMMRCEDIGIGKQRWTPDEISLQSKLPEDRYMSIR